MREEVSSEAHPPTKLRHSRRTRSRAGEAGRVSGLHFAGARPPLPAIFKLKINNRESMKRIIFFVLSMSQTCVSHAASMQWYIMLGAFKQENHGEVAASNLRNTASKCGFDAKFDYSVTIRGTTLGYVITFIGPFEKRSIAEDLLPKVKTCIPEAYIKQVVFDD